MSRKDEHILLFASLYSLVSNFLSLPFLLLSIHFSLALQKILTG